MPGQLEQQEVSGLRQGHKRLWTALIVLTLIFIWGNSLLPPQKSWEVSDAVRKLLSCFTPVGGPAGGADELWGVVVRKLAHFTEFCVLGTLLRLRFRSERKAPWLPLLAGLLAALMDETIQYYTGRTSLVFDVWLDFFGVAVGVFIAAGLLAGKGRGSPKKRQSIAKYGWREEK